MFFLSMFGFLFSFTLLLGFSSAYVVTHRDSSSHNGECYGKDSRGPWEVCRFQNAIIDHTKSKCSHTVCLPYNFDGPSYRTWGRTYTQPDCQRRFSRRRHDALLIEMEYTHGTFFHFLAQVLMKVYVASSELSMNSTMYIIMSGKHYTKGHTEWLQLFTKHPVRSAESVREDECWDSVSVVKLEDWFNGAFHLLHLEWKPEYSLRTFADFLHLRSGTKKRTLIPQANPLKVGGVVELGCVFELWS
jgi:hypothetical protein